MDQGSLATQQCMRYIQVQKHKKHLFMFFLSPAEAQYAFLFLKSIHKLCYCLGISQHGIVYRISITGGTGP
jgi:hypothetical protein